jgi:tetratricopeptide (TPR) repeat protein
MRFIVAGVVFTIFTTLIEAGVTQSREAPVNVLVEDSIVAVTLTPKAVGSRNAIQTVSVFEYQVPKTARKEFTKAEDAAHNADCPDAIEHLKAALAIFERYAAAHNAAGNCYAKTGATGLAEESFKRAMALTSAVYPALNLADLYTDQQRFNEAGDVLINAIRRSPTEGDGYYGLAVLRFKEDRLEEAARWAIEAHRHSLHIPDVHILLAKIYDRKAKDDLVLRELHSYVKEAKPGETRTKVQQMLKKSRRP